ncbi:MAG: S41 family peptidase, partial [Bacteroidales bacterium]|nr:S41 family peptidase [Bacteroidales bacterium]
MRNRLFSIILLFFVFISAQSQLRLGSDAIKLDRTIRLINDLYVDDVNTEEITESAIRNMLKELDPHSSYLNKEEVKEMNEPLQGNFDGIGISFNMLTDTIYVMEVISGGPSQKVGIMPGDKIIYVNDTLIAGQKKTNRDVISRLRGKKGTTVKVKILRKGVEGLTEFRIIRDNIPIYSIDASYMVNNNTGYIRLSRFGVTSYKEFHEAIIKLKTKGMNNLIVDLTGNGGGILSTSTDITDEFLDEDRLMVYTEGKNQPRMTINSTSKGEFKSGKLVVLVNEGSASASEILSGAVQDWDRGVIVGRRTFGKGLVQRQLPLTDGTMIRLTVARYYTPTGRGIQKPYNEGDLEAYNLDFINRYNHGEMINADSIHFPDSLKYATLINKRTVYGGGGVMPDVFVPIDTTLATSLHLQLLAKGVLNKIAIQEVDNNRKQLLSNYTTIESFIKNYTISPALIQKIKNIAQEEDIEWNNEEFEKSKKLILTQMKGLIARDVYDSSAFYRIINDIDDIFSKGLEVITNDKLYY